MRLLHLLSVVIAIGTNVLAAGQDCDMQHFMSMRQQVVDSWGAKADAEIIVFKKDGSKVTGKVMQDVKDTPAGSMWIDLNWRERLANPKLSIKRELVQVADMAGAQNARAVLESTLSNAQTSGTAIMIGTETAPPRPGKVTGRKGNTLTVEFDDPIAGKIVEKVEVGKITYADAAAAPGAPRLALSRPSNLPNATYNADTGELILKEGDPGRVISLKGDNQYVSVIPVNGDQRKAVKVVNIQQDARGKIYVEVEDPIHGTRYLTDAEIETLRVSKTSKETFTKDIAKPRPREPAPAPDPAPAPRPAKEVPRAKAAAGPSTYDAAKGDLTLSSGEVVSARYESQYAAVQLDGTTHHVKILGITENAGGKIEVQVFDLKTKSVLTITNPEDITSFRRSSTAFTDITAYENNAARLAKPRQKLKGDYKKSYDEMEERIAAASNAPEPKVANASEDVLASYQAKGKKPPAPKDEGEAIKLNGEYNEKKKIFKPGRWQKTAEAKSSVTYKGATLKETRGGVSGLVKSFDTVENGQTVTKFFRSTEAENGLHSARAASASRKTHAASHLNEMLGMETVPRARIGTVNGQTGVISDAAPGTRGDWLVKQGKKGLGDNLPISRVKGLDQRSVADNEAFEFLVGNSDVHVGNMSITEQGKIKVFDHDMAFASAIPGQGRPPRSLGTHLPERYSREFVDTLKATSPEKIISEMGPFLTPNELEGVLFRREVILKDVELRTAQGQNIFL